MLDSTMLNQIGLAIVFAENNISHISRGIHTEELPIIRDGMRCIEPSMTCKQSPFRMTDARFFSLTNNDASLKYMGPLYDFRVLFLGRYKYL